MNLPLFRRLPIAAALILVATSALASGGAVSLIPSDAVSVGVVRVADLRTSPLSSTLFQHADRFGSNGEAEDFLNDAGLDLAKDIDVLVIATAPTTRLGSDAEVVVIADGRFAVARLSAALLERGAVKKSSAYGDYFGLPEGARADKQGAVAFPSAALAIAGSESAVLKALQARAQGGAAFEQSLLGHHLGRIDAGASAWALVDVIRATRLTGGTARLGHGDDHHGAALSAAVRNISTVGLWATDTGNALQLGAVGLASDTETLQLVEDTIRGALSALRLSVKDRSPELVSVLRKFDVQRSSDSVRISGSIPGDSLRKLMAEKRARK
ncbi:MAG TPA: hypothetical protein VM779_00500 [Thermoanaerobaculia bacterium]|nr:hypothetical protein [Thermoanaerobaculia bacterium]